ncbi:MAG: hypothetical protein Kow0069_14210 [Promethearchaeota archaeon]
MGDLTTTYDATAYFDVVTGDLLREEVTVHEVAGSAWYHHEVVFERVASWNATVELPWYGTAPGGDGGTGGGDGTSTDGTGDATGDGAGEGEASGPDERGRDGNSAPFLGSPLGSLVVATAVVVPLAAAAWIVLRKARNVPDRDLLDVD